MPSFGVKCETGWPTMGGMGEILCRRHGHVECRSRTATIFASNPLGGKIPALSLGGPEPGTNS
jgi:hypothetical protein